MEQLVRQFPAVDILVNNLGIFEPKPFEQIPDADWRRFFEVNVLSGVRLSRAYLPGMKSKNWGRIIFISSESGIQIPAEMIHYGMTKTAQLAVSRGLAETCAGTGVTVNAVLPGPTRSDGVDEFVKQLSGGKPFAEFEKEFFASRPAQLPAAAVCDHGRSGQPGGVSGQPAVRRHQRRGPARGRRRGARLLLRRVLSRSPACHSRTTSGNHPGVSAKASFCSSRPAGSLILCTGAAIRPALCLSRSCSIWFL